MLVFQSAAPFPVQDSPPWPDFRMPPPGVMLELAESQTHRRCLKSHSLYDPLPIYKSMKVIHVARDGRDTAMSIYYHKVNFTEEVADSASEVMLADPKFGTSFHRIEADPARHFHEWLVGDEDPLDDLGCGFWYMENSYWAARKEPEVLLVHYADMKQDLNAA
jgi:aryl sulfotransferase